MGQKLLMKKLKFLAIESTCISFPTSSIFFRAIPYSNIIVAWVPRLVTSTGDNYNWHHTFTSSNCWLQCRQWILTVLLGLGGQLWVIWFYSLEDIISVKPYQDVVSDQHVKVCVLLDIFHRLVLGTHWMHQFFRDL